MIVVGVDEAGVGCWAGPLVIASAAFDEDTALPELVRDSKTLSEEQREGLIDEIYWRAEWVIIKVAPPAYINNIRAIWTVWHTLMEDLLLENQIREPGKIIVDGTRMVPGRKGITYEKKADSKYREVSAASIVAKYVQTCAMEDLHDMHAEFRFNKHHGYGTAYHRRKLEELGPTSAHRLDYKPVAKVMRKLPAARSRDLRQTSFLDARQPTTRIIER